MQFAFRLSRALTSATNAFSVCQTILEDEKREQAAAPARRLPRPPEIKQFLDGYVIGQERTRKSSPSRSTTTTRGFSQQAARGCELSKSTSADWTDWHGQDAPRANSLPHARCPFAIVDATTLTEAGYVGEDVKTSF